MSIAFSSMHGYVLSVAHCFIVVHTEFVSQPPLFSGGRFRAILSELAWRQQSH